MAVSSHRSFCNQLSGGYFNNKGVTQKIRALSAEEGANDLDDGSLKGLLISIVTRVSPYISRNISLGCLCIYIYIGLFIYLFIYIYIYLFIFIYIYIYIYLNIYIYIYIFWGYTHYVRISIIIRAICRLSRFDIPTWSLKCDPQSCTRILHVGLQ